MGRLRNNQVAEVIPHNLKEESKSKEDTTLPNRDAEVILDENHGECVVCAMRPLLILGTYIGVIPHGIKRKETTCAYCISIFHIAKSGFYILVLASAALLNAKELYDMDELSFNAHVLYISSQIVITAGCAAMCFFVVLDIPYMITEIDGFNAVIQLGRSYGFNTFFDKASYRETRTISSELYLVMITYVVMAIFYYLYIFSTNDNPDILFLYRHIIVSLAACQCAVKFLIFTTMNRVYMRLYKDLNERLRKKYCYLQRHIWIKCGFEKNELWDLLSIPTEDEIIEYQKPNDFLTFLPLWKQTAVIRRVYKAVYFNAKLTHLAFDPLKLLFFLSLVAFNVMNICFYFLKHEVDEYLYWMISQSVFEWMMFIYVLYYADKLADVLSDIAAYFYKFPISGLPEKEGTQVEMFLAMLETQKPQFKASGIFTLSSSILASTSGTTVTYILTLMQFQETTPSGQITFANTTQFSLE